MSNEQHPLERASLKVLEDWALALVDPAPTLSSDMFDSEMPVYMSWINLHGVISGAVSIIAQEPFLRQLAENVLGANSDGEIDLEQCKDAFREMGNVLGGNFLTEAYGEDVVFDLLNPSVSEVPFSEVERFVSRNVVFGFLADDAPVAVTFSIKKG